MCASILGFQAPLLRAIVDELEIMPILQIARQAGVQEIYRITVHLYDGRACNSVATLQASHVGGIALEVVYQRALNRKPIVHRIEDGRYREFIRAIKSLSFDKMGDQPILPAYNSTDLWLIERAAATFYHSVILAPDLAGDDHARLANTIKNGLPEALRLVK